VRGQDELSTEEKRNAWCQTYGCQRYATFGWTYCCQCCQQSKGWRHGTTCATYGSTPHWKAPPTGPPPKDEDEKNEPEDTKRPRGTRGGKKNQNNKANKAWWKAQGDGHQAPQNGGELLTQAQLPKNHPGRDLSPPDDHTAWFLKRHDAARPSAWSHAAAGALTFQTDVFEVFIATDAKPASIETIAQNFDRSRIIELKKKTLIEIDEAISHAAIMKSQNQPGKLPSFGKALKNTLISMMLLVATFGYHDFRAL